LSAPVKRDTLQPGASPPGGGQLTYSDENPASDNDGSWSAAIFVGLVFAAALLFTLYVLLWDGGAHT
jgi:hypothetical protein